MSEVNKLQLLYYSWAVYLLLFSASYCLHSPITASGAHCRRSACIEYQSEIRASCGSGLLRHFAEFQHSVVYDAIDQWRKRLEACIYAEGSHFEHLLWRCLPDIPVATHHNRFFLEPPMPTHNRLYSPTFEGTQQTFSQMKSFAVHKLVWWHFHVGWASGLQFVFFLDNENNQK